MNWADHMRDGVCPECEAKEEVENVGMDETRVRFTGKALDRLMEQFELFVNGRHLAELEVAYDDLDQAIKFKVNGGVWSPPFSNDVPPNWQREK